MLDINIDFSGGTYTVYNTSMNVFQILDSGTLSSNYTIAASGTYFEGNSFVFYYKAIVDKASYNFNILGTNLTDLQLSRESTIEAVYNGTSWDLNVLPNTKSAGWISTTDSPLIGNDLVLMTYTISFESGKQGNNSIYVPFDFALNDAHYCVTKAIAGTDNANIEIFTNGVSRGVTTILASTVINTVAQCTISDNTGDSGGSYMQTRGVKTTPGGEVLLSLILERI